MNEHYYIVINEDNFETRIAKDGVPKMIPLVLKTVMQLSLSLYGSLVRKSCRKGKRARRLHHSDAVKPIPMGRLDGNSRKS